MRASAMPRPRYSSSPFAPRGLKGSTAIDFIGTAADCLASVEARKRIATIAVTASSTAPARTAGASQRLDRRAVRSEEHTSELQSQFHLVCRLLLEKKNK